MRSLAMAAMIGLCASMGWSDGGFVAVPQGVAETADQRAIIIDAGNTETLVLQTGYDGDASDFAWLIPVPTRIHAAEAVATVDPAVFDALDRVTSPVRIASVGTSGACGCAGSEGTREVADGVTVWETLRVDDYDVAVLSADESANLARWLTDNGYALPSGNEDTLQYYVDRDSFFVALKIAPADEQAGGDGRTQAPGVPATEDLRPITLTFAIDDLVFPLRISRISTRERVEVLLYVLAPHRVRGGNHATAEIDVPDVYAGEDFTAAYDAWFEEALEDTGDSGLVVEFAGRIRAGLYPELAELIGPDEEYFLTRLRTRLRAEDMAEDIVLVRAASDEQFSVIVDAGGTRTRGLIAFALLLGGLGSLTVHSPRVQSLGRAATIAGLLIMLL